MQSCLRLLAGLLLALASPALARAAPAEGQAADCHAYAASPAQVEALRQGTTGWICEDRAWHANARFALLRFTLGKDGRVPAEYVSRLARFETLDLYLERSEGSTAHYTFSPRDFVQRGHMGMALALPEAGRPAMRATVVLTGPTGGALVNTARLRSTPLPLIGAEQLWITLLCGLLMVPLIFNLALFRALRDRFLLWHTGLVAFMLGHTLLSSGLLPLIRPVPVGTIALLVPLMFCAGAACVLMLIRDFIEPSMLSPRFRRALVFVAGWVLLDAAFFLTTIDWLQGRGLAIYLSAWLVVAAVLFVTIGSALRNGSRSAKFLAASLLPLILTGLWQIAESMLGDQTEPMLLFIAQRMAIGAEVLITSIGIADRFIQLRRDRDDHRELASELTRLAERDPLTGLLNRRAIEERFAMLRAKGFATLALLDLDHFKAVNDRFGHAVGDDVLSAVSASLPEDRDALAMRMGGEEFMLLLRGPGAVRRAEQVRRALTARVAHDVSGLDGPVTASMGLVEIPAEVMPDATFAAIYARADGLLYQAKRAGRNRTVSERMTVFGRQPRSMGRSAAA
ncbi:MAG: diguanylate cyclase [Novosphingobium sp.]